MNDNKKNNSLTYQPIDKWAATLLEEPSRSKPYIIASVVIFVLALGIQLYTYQYKKKAIQYFNQNEYQRVVKDYSRSSVAYLARLKLGKEALDQKKYDEAIAWYQPVAEKSGLEPILQISAIQNLAFAYMKKGETDKALSLLEQAKKDKKNVTADYSLLLEGRVYEVKGDSAKALEIYKQLSEGSSLSKVKEEASNRLLWLSKK